MSDTRSLSEVLMSQPGFTFGRKSAFARRAAKSKSANPRPTKRELAGMKRSAEAAARKEAK